MNQHLGNEETKWKESQDMLYEDMLCCCPHWWHVCSIEIVWSHGQSFNSMASSWDIPTVTSRILRLALLLGLESTTRTMSWNKQREAHEDLPSPHHCKFPPQKKSWNKQQSPNVAGDYLYCIAIQHFLVNGWACWNFCYMASHFWKCWAGSWGQLVPATIPLLRVAHPEIQAKNTISWKMMVGRVLSFWKGPCSEAMFCHS